ncbi:hypothetical protein CYMTET_3000 [Cymbomonas tetramitiformis]|uniref:Uncharacterized protein n=1 Tax=Cymbomonas tetramitiformis TaxID=36881 RepID=A0AAE0LLG2_9CHLO|nr:hypothetical protein CYMTET_3000 [Cymbomonas tetramitiformis]|eukprot:gene3519-4431_t
MVTRFEIEKLFELVLPDSRQKFYEECVPKIAKELASHRKDDLKFETWFHFFAGLYDAFLRTSHDLSRHLNWKLEDSHWFAANALEVYRHVRWVNFKANRSVDIDDSQFEIGLCEYLAESKTLAFGSANRDTEDTIRYQFDRLFCVALAERAMSAFSTKELSEHVLRGTGLERAQLRSVLASCAQRGPSMSGLWWVKTTDEGFSEIHRSRWMHRVTHFVMEDYTALMDDVCYHFGVAVTIALTEDRAAWWKVCREDAESCAQHVRGMSTKDRSTQEISYKDGPYPDLAYHVPVRVARQGLYPDAGVRESELLALFERVTSYIRRGERLTHWLCEKAGKILVELKLRMYTGNRVQVIAPDEVREIHDGVVGAVTGVNAIRTCTLHTSEARHACVHTRSEAFAGLVQMINLLRQRWDSADQRLRDVEAQLRAYVEDLCTLAKPDKKQELCKSRCSPRQAASHRPRRAQLDSFLEIIVSTDVSKWAEKDLVIESEPSSTRDLKEPCQTRARVGAEEPECDFLDVLLRCGDHPVTYEQESNFPMYGVYHEADTSKPIAALPPLGTIKAATTKVRLSQWQLELRDAYPCHVPVKEDRLCRRRYRAIPLRFSSSEQTEFFLDTFLRGKCDDASRQKGLQDLCRYEPPVLEFFEQIVCERFDVEVACMHDERAALLLVDDTFSNIRAGLMELVFWIREYVDGQRRWLRPERLCQEHLPKAWRSRETYRSSVWADVFVVYPDEFRIAFKHNEKGMSNCVGVSRPEAQTPARFLRYTLRPNRTTGDLTLQSLQSLLRGEWYACFHADGEMVVRVEEWERHTAEIAIGFEHIDTYQTEPCICDVREAVFVPGALFSVASMGNFVKFLFWSLFQSMSVEINRPWTGLVPKKPLTCLPHRSSAKRHCKANADKHEVCVADSRWREYVMWVTVELQRVALSMRTSTMSPRIAGAGLGVMASYKIYGGETVSSALRGLNECRTERTKQVVRPNSYLNTRTLSLLNNIGCTYFPFDTSDVMDRCMGAIGFVKVPGYDSKKHPYLHKVFVDSKGDLRDDVPMCFASPTITPVAFSEAVRNRHGRSGYLHLNNGTVSIATLQADLRYMRTVNVCDTPKCPPLISPKLNRRDPSNKEDEATRSVIDRIELIAHRAAMEKETDPVSTQTSSDDIHSSQSVGVVGAHMSRKQGAQFGSRFVFCDAPTEKGESGYRLCLEDLHRRASLGFCELGVDFWSDLKSECLLPNEIKLFPVDELDTFRQDKSLQCFQQVALRPFRRLLVPAKDLPVMEPVLGSIGWSQVGWLEHHMCIFNPGCASEACTYFDNLPPNMCDWLKAATRSVELGCPHTERSADLLFDGAMKTLLQTRIVKSTCVAVRPHRVVARTSHEPFYGEASVRAFQFMET